MSSPVPEGWAEVDGALERTWQLDSFPDAIAFVNRVAELAESENHHPDIAISYRTVTSAGARTARTTSPTDDRDLAARSGSLV